MSGPNTNVLPKMIIAISIYLMLTCGVVLSACDCFSNKDDTGSHAELIDLETGKAIALYDNVYWHSVDEETGAIRLWVRDGGKPDHHIITEGRLLTVRIVEGRLEQNVVILNANH